MVERFNGFGKQRAKEKAGHGHQHLEAAEPESAGRLRLQRCLFHGKALAYGHCESVHAQSHRQQEQFSDSHKKSSVLNTSQHRETKRLCRPAKVSSFQAEPGPHQYVDSVPRCAPTTPSSRRIITKIPPLVKAKRRNTQLFYKWVIAHSTTSTAALLLKATTIRLLPR